MISPSLRVSSQSVYVLSDPKGDLLFSYFTLPPLHMAHIQSSDLIPPFCVLGKVRAVHLQRPL